MPGRMKLKKTNSFLKKHNPQAFNSEFIHHKLYWLTPQNIKAKFHPRKAFSENGNVSSYLYHTESQKLSNSDRSHVDNNFSYFFTPMTLREDRRKQNPLLFSENILKGVLKSNTYCNITIDMNPLSPVHAAVHYTILWLQQ